MLKADMRGRLGALGLGLLLAGPAAAQPDTGAGQLSWALKNNFPLFKSGTALGGVVGLKPGQSMLEWSEKVLAAKPELLGQLLAPYAYKASGGCSEGTRIQDFKTLWDPCSETYDKALFESPASYTIVAALTPPRPGQCRFSWGQQAPVLAACDKALDITVAGSGTLLKVQELSSGAEHSAHIEIKDVLLFAFGDSFSSGESNPDVPVLHNNFVPANGTDQNQNYLGANWIDSPQRLQQLTRQNQWLDRRCHRSIISWPILSAMRLALENPHMVVRMASWACTGAEITDGFFSPQKRENEENKRNVQLSQFAAAREAICVLPQQSGAPFKSTHYKEKTKKSPADSGWAEDSGCNAATGRRREIDAALFTLGGNDVFFAPVISDAVAITGVRVPLLNPLLKAVRKSLVKKPAAAKARIEGHDEVPETDRLKTRYAALGRAFNALGLPFDRVVQLQYPAPVYEKPGVYCNADPDAGFTVLNKLQFHTNVTTWEAEQAEQGMIKPLTKAIDGMPWSKVDGYLAKMGEHGLCANQGKRHSEFAFPLYRGYGQFQDNYTPSSYNHYAVRQRWFRTPDDVVMGMFSGGKWAPLDGAFHPSAQAHAEMADQTYEELRRRFAEGNSLKP